MLIFYSYILGTGNHSEGEFHRCLCSLQDGARLEDRIGALLHSEYLDGENMYRCPQCAKLRPASRRMRPTRLPPILNFALNRFIYDPKLEDRKKVKASIEYPKKITLAGKEFELCGVITHQGSTVSSRNGVSDEVRLIQAISFVKSTTRGTSLLVFILIIVTKNGTPAMTSWSRRSPSRRGRRSNYRFLPLPRVTKNRKTLICWYTRRSLL